MSTTLMLKQQTWFYSLVDSLSFFLIKTSSLFDHSLSERKAKVTEPSTTQGNDPKKAKAEAVTFNSADKCHNTLCSAYLNKLLPRLK